MTTLDAGTILKSRLQSYRDTREHVRAPMPSELKQDIISYITKRSREDTSVQQASKEIGLGPTIFRNWIKDQEKGKGSKKPRVKKYNPPTDENKNTPKLRILVAHPTLGEIIIEGRKAMEVWNKISRLG